MAQKCDHKGPLEDEDFDLDDLLVGISSGDDIFFSGDCLKCKEHVTRKYTCASTVVSSEDGAEAAK